MPLRIQTLDHLVINVVNVPISVYWYQRTLGMEREDYSARAGEDPRTTLKLGRQRIELRPVSASPREWITADHRTTGTQSLCFVTAMHPRKIIKHLVECGIEVVAGPVEARGPNGTLTSVFCRDPDGNLIEVSTRKCCRRPKTGAFENRPHVRNRHGGRAQSLRR
jgi:catechol 2,3-dioxygenase-like lactoylglutathione lyase family enzyme